MVWEVVRNHGQLQAVKLPVVQPEYLVYVC